MSCRSLRTSRRSRCGPSRGAADRRWPGAVFRRRSCGRRKRRHGPPACCRRSVCTAALALDPAGALHQEAAGREAAPCRADTSPLVSGRVVSQARVVSASAARTNRVDNAAPLRLSLEGYHFADPGLALLEPGEPLVPESDAWARAGLHPVANAFEELARLGVGK